MSEVPPPEKMEIFDRISRPFMVLFGFGIEWN
jgi:hypothetical protein